MSTNWTPTTLVAIADDYDRDMADANAALSSRYGVYLAQNAKDLYDDERFDPAIFSAWAWSVARGPIMSPGYVRTRPDLQTVRFHRSDEDGRPYVVVGVPIQHHSLSKEVRPPHRVDDWEADRFGSGDYHSMVVPHDGKLTPKSSLLISAELRVPADDWPLHQPGDWTQLHELLVDDAKNAVARLVELINAHVGPQVAALLGDGGTW